MRGSMRKFRDTYHGIDEGVLDQLGRTARKFKAIRSKFKNRYRPERHYMRGPGPAYRAKHAHA